MCVENFEVPLKKYFLIEDLTPYEKILITKLDFNKRVKHQLKNNHCENLAMLLDRTAQEILNFDKIGATSLKNIIHTLKKYFSIDKLFPVTATDIKKIEHKPVILDESNFKEFIGEIISDTCKDEKGFYIVKLRSSGKKLAEIGEIFDLSRERVRQIISFFIERFSNFYSEKVKDFFYALHKTFNNKTIVTSKELESFLGPDLTRVFLFFVKNLDWKDQDFYFDTGLNAIIFNEKVNEDFDYDKFIHELPETLLRDELEERILQILREEKCSEDILRMKISKVYHSQGIFVYRTRIKLFYKCSYVLKNKFSDGYKVGDKKCYEDFLQELREIFDPSINSSHRALDNDIAAYVGVLCDRGKYIHPDFVNVPQEIVDMIFNFINSSERTVLSYKEIFYSLKDKLAGTQITNQYFLQGIIKLNKFPFILHKDYLTKNEYMNLADEFNLYVKKHGFVTAKEIYSDFPGFDETNIALLIGQCPEILRLERLSLMHSSQLNLQEQDFVEIEKFVRKICEKSPINSKYLFNVFVTQFKDFVERNKIITQERLFSVIQYMFSDKFNFSRPYIALRDIKNITNKEVLLNYLEGVNKVAIQNLTVYCTRHKIGYITINNLAKELLPEFVRADKFNLCRPETVGITEEVIAKVAEIVKSEMDNNDGWLAVRNFNDYKLLPKVDIEWNSFLLESVSAIGLKDLKIFRNTGTPAADSSAVFVFNEFEEEDLKSFMVKILIKAHKNKPFKNRDEIFNWLKNRGLINLVMPKFLTAEKHIYFDKDNKLQIN